MLNRSDFKTKQEFKHAKKVEAEERRPYLLAMIIPAVVLGLITGSALVGFLTFVVAGIVLAFAVYHRSRSEGR